MNVDITGHHVEVSDALRSYINEKSWSGWRATSIMSARLTSS